MITSYSWTQTKGPFVRLNGADTKTTSFKIWNCILSPTAASHDANTTATDFRTNNNIIVTSIIINEVIMTIK